MGAIIKRHRDENGNPLYYITSSAAVGMSDGSGSLDAKLFELDKKFNELNISALYPTKGIGGTNKYNLAGAISRIPSNYRNVALKITFIDETDNIKKYIYCGKKITTSFTEFADENLWLPEGAVKLYENNGTDTSYVCDAREGDIFYFTLRATAIKDTIIFYSDDNLKHVISTVKSSGSGLLSGVKGVAPLGTRKVKFEWSNTTGYPNRLYLYTDKGLSNSLYDSEINSLLDSLKVGQTQIKFGFNWVKDKRYINGELLTMSLNSGCSADNTKYTIKKGESIYIHSIYKSKNYPYDIISFFDNADNFVTSITVPTGDITSTIDDIVFTAPKDGYVKLGSTYSTSEPIFNFPSNFNNVFDTIDEKYKSLADKQLVKINTLNFTNDVRLNDDGTTTVLSANSGVCCDETYYPVKKGDVFKIEGLTQSKTYYVNGLILYDTNKNAIRDNALTFKIDANAVPTLENSPLIVATQDGFVRFGAGYNNTYNIDKLYNTTSYFRNSEINDELEDIRTNLFSSETLIINGDSTAQGLAKWFTSDLINNERKIQSIDPGPVGSETVRATAARQGGVPCIVMPFTIPAEVKEIVTDSTSDFSNTDPAVNITSNILFKQQYADDGTPLEPSIQENSSMRFVGLTHYWFYCYINGVYGRLYTIGGYKIEGGELVQDDTSSTTFFHREEAGEEVIVDKPTEVVPAEGKLWKYSININLMGTNGGFNNYGDDYVTIGNGSATSGQHVDPKQAAKNLFDIQKRMYQYCNGKYLVIGYFQPTIITQEFYEEYESLCEHEFGQNFFNARIYLKDYAWKDLKITLTDNDKNNMKAGRPPFSLFDSESSPHLHDEAKKALANQVALRLFELGWLTKYPNLYKFNAN